MIITKITCFGLDKETSKVFEITLEDRTIHCIANIQGASGYDDVMAFINNPNNADKIQYINIDFLEKKTSKLNIRLNFLNETDWYITRQEETKESIPQAIKAKRTKARQEISLLKPIQTMEELDGLQLEKDEYFSV